MDDSTTEKVRASVDEKIHSFVEGSLEHGTETFLALFEIATKEGDLNPSVNAPIAVSQFSFCAVLNSLDAKMVTSHHQATRVASPAH